MTLHPGVVSLCLLNIILEPERITKVFKCCSSAVIRRKTPQKYFFKFHYRSNTLEQMTPGESAVPWRFPLRAFVL